VECNHGSKYFDNGFEAFAYFSEMSITQKSTVELWLVQKEVTRKLFSVTQELVAYSPLYKGVMI